jgi:hypothetical protein
MSLARRSFAVLLGVFLLQLTLLGSGTFCAARHSAHGMLGMSATTVVAASSSMSVSADDSSPMDSTSCNGPAKHDDCRLPWSPGQCSAMTACAIGVSAVDPLTLVAVLDASTLVVPFGDRLLSGPAFAPELPPPRA